MLKEEWPKCIKQRNSLKLLSKYCFKPTRKYVVIGITLVVGAFFLMPLPHFEDSTSTVLFSQEGKLLGAKIAQDEQWRFEESDSLPDKFKVCITNFEDQYFYRHWGVNPVSIVRAAFLNIKYGKIVSGGSTITMQTIRLMRRGQKRSIEEKLIEILFAFRLELKYSKQEILNKYASHAPFGGNVVGLEAASWRYYGRSPQQLSWAETAGLAILPNAPSLIYPGKNTLLLKQKRNNLLQDLYEKDIIDKITYHLSVQEPLPQKALPLLQQAPHLLDLLEKERMGAKLQSTINYHYQSLLRRQLNLHSKNLSRNEIHNAAAIVVDNESGAILAYVGNSDYTQAHNNSVDVIRAPRSSGSILKPLLYTAMLDGGDILPRSLVPDYPLFFDGFTPENYNLAYDGAVPADEALLRSLNIPFVYLLKQYGVDKFHHVLNQLGFTTINKAPDHYGLSLILGGAEVTLFDLVNVYSCLARTLDHTATNEYKYLFSDNEKIHYVPAIYKDSLFSKSPLNFSAGAIWTSFETMKNLNRPANQSGWESFSSAYNIAWKTGTSFGFRDAWAIGVSKDYTVGVWVGNADGEGRPGLTGLTAAAPLMFNIFDFLDPQGWFKEPYDEFTTALVCKESGHLASRHCVHIDTCFVLAAGTTSPVCPYHKVIHLDSSGIYRVNQDCADFSNIIHKSWFVLPPRMEWIYKKVHPEYRELPPLRPDCNSQKGSVMQFIYPQNVTRIFIPRNVGGHVEDVIFEVAHQDDNAVLFWHLDNTYVGITSHIHQFALCPSQGMHTITVVDRLGNSIKTQLFFER